MNIIGVQLVLCFFALFMVYVLFLHWKKRNISTKFFSLWLFIWVVFVFFTFFPNVLEPLIKELFIIRVMDLGIIGALMIITFITVENNIKIRKMEDQMERLVRRISVRKIKSGK